MLTTPGGNPASAISAPNSTVDSGVSSEGLTTTQLPAASAGAIFNSAMLSGKFHGTMRPQTPSGSRSVKSNKVLSETSSVSPDRPSRQPA